ncbi:PQQ-dependent catabolism-associated CXXCW motif protein [Salmonella enterica subsp. enterica]|nr:PQQ-dependent catabolism-associated CXXCW motif protein [Salmonella enterica subsp. enterica serovar Enteritidis]
MIRQHCLKRPVAALAVGLAFALAGALSSHAEDYPPGVDPKTGYRMENLRAPTPDVLPGGKVVNYATVEKASKGGGDQLIDVYGKGATADPDSGEWSNSDNRMSIPGSAWLPNVGNGALTAEMQAYFDRNLEALTGGDKGKGLIFYCMSDCWTSWNAAQRAIRGGYSNVGWYPLGTDGWREHGGELVSLKAANLHGKGS